MYKLIISPKRYSAIVHASHLLDNRCVVMTISNGLEEPNIYELCLEAKKIQKRFEVEKAYKIFRVRQLYCFDQNFNTIDYQFVITKLTLMLVVSPFTHICYMDVGDPLLLEIFEKSTGVESRIIYTDNTVKSLEYKLDDKEIELKLDAIQRMPTIRKKLLYEQDLNTEYIQRTV